jgi:hypothetical protein
LTVDLRLFRLQFRVTTLDVGVPEEAEQIVELAETMAPVGGVFHLAMYLADKLITNQARYPPPPPTHPRPGLLSHITRSVVIYVIVVSLQ